MKPACRIFLFIFIFTLSGPVAIWCQRPSDNPLNQNPIGRSTTIDSTDSGVLPLDTAVSMKYVLIEDPEILYTQTDTFLWGDNQHHPLSFYQAHLGNYGSPTRSLIPILNKDHRFKPGWDQYDPYFIHQDSFRYYHQNVPVAKAKYSQSGQEETYFSLDFGRSFAKGISLSMMYDRINQVGEFGPAIENTPLQKNTAFGIGIWHDAPSGKYDAFYNFLSNTVVGDENGGISEPDLIGSELFPNRSVPVHLQSGLSTQKHRFFSTKQILHLFSETADVGIDLWLEAQFATGLYKYSDVDTSNQEYYGAFLFDARGIRQFTYQDETAVSFGISLPWKAARSTIQSSLSFRAFDLEQEPEKRNINELYWNAGGKFQWIEALKLNGNISIGLGQAEGAFLFQAEGVLNTGVAGKLRAYYGIMSRKPYVIESKLFINQQLMYQNDFDNPLTNEISASWIWEKQNLEAGLKWFVFDNYIFFDADKKPAQINTSFSLRQLFISKVVDLTWIGAKGHVIWQPDSRTELAMPDFLLQAGLYGRMHLFKRKLTVMPGVDITHHSGFQGVSFFPVIGRYHLTDGPAIPDYFRVDAALGIKINFLKAFVRMEDIAGFRQNRVLYQADFYPHYPGYLRIGIETGFYN